jgi:hypothetical protein
MVQKTENFDLVVIGGGLAGFSAAIAAARQGLRACLVQDRPVLGGNSSSEVRVTPHGACCFHSYARETGIISELLIEERAINHEPTFENGWINSMWDVVLYDMAMSTPGVTLHMNTSLTAVQLGAGKQIEAAVCSVAAAETELVLKAPLFVDASGDGLLAHLAGCEWRMGSEGRDEFNEPHAPLKATNDTMGSSIQFKTKDMGHPVPFKAPDWAVKYEDASFFYKQGRDPSEIRGGFWWIEIGVPWHSIHDNEDIRHELTRHCLGVWDWIKNRDPLLKDKVRNFGLDWMGQVPGKRESRRIQGQYFMTEKDPQECTVFPDEVAFGGWFVDLHTPGGLLASTSEASAATGYDPSSEYAAKSYVGPYGIPLRMLIARDCPNLMMAGRNVSVTHAALGTVRVMATTALMGQAVGTAAAVALRHNLGLHEVASKAAPEIQQSLLRQGCFLPNVKNQDPLDLARQAQASASSQALLSGAGPQDRGAYENFVYEKEKADGSEDGLTRLRAQNLAFAGPRLDKVSVCLSNYSDKVQTVQAEIYAIDHLWDYRSHPGQPLASATLELKPGLWQWVAMETKLGAGPGLKPHSFLRLNLGENPQVAWHRAGRAEPGHISYFQMAPGRLRRYHYGTTLSFKLEPAQACYDPQNVLSGVTRPHRGMNLWRSDPAQPLPQWLQLDWQSPQAIHQIELSFPGQLMQEYHSYPPFYRAPECPKDYSMQAWLNGAWQELLTVKDNYQRHRIHRLPKPASTAKLRLLVSATHGDPSASVYEIRCYA